MVVHHPQKSEPRSAVEILREEAGQRLFKTAVGVETYLMEDLASLEH